jgi:hypothetical protein
MMTDQPILLALAALLVPPGIALVVLGIRRYAEMRRISPREHAKALTSMQAFRISIVGASLLALALALAFEQVWLGAIAIVIGLEELFESSMAIFAMKHGANLKVRL